MQDEPDPSVNLPHIKASGTSAGPEVLPLLPMQQWMWRSQMVHNRADLGLMQVVVALREAVDLARLRAAWASVVAQHPILRTRLVWESDVDPGQLVEPQVEVPWTALDWRALTTEATAEVPDQRWETLLREDRQRGLDLRVAPLLRFTCVTLDETETRLLWTFHHILLDGSSIPLVLEDAFAAYQALREGRAVPAPERPAFAQFVRWHQAWWEAHHAPAEVFWRNYLRGLTEPTTLTVETTAADPADDAAAEQAGFALSPEETARLQQTAAALGITTSTFLLAAWGLLLRHYAGKDDVIFGTVGAGRGDTFPGADRAVGLFITNVPIRFSFAGTATVRTVLRELRALHLAVRQFEHTPLHLRSRWSELPAGAPLVGSVIVFDRDSIAGRMAQKCGAPGRTFELRQQPDQGLLLAVTGGERLTGDVVFEAARYPREIMRRLAGQLAHLLRELPVSLDLPLQDVPILPPEEWAELVRFGQGPESSAGSERRLQEWFELQARKRPEAVAIQRPDTATTYGQLETAANRLGHYLQRLGAAPDRIIAIILPRSAELVTAAIGVLKSGAAYLPLDPELPPARLAAMVEAAGPLAVITGPGCTLSRTAGCDRWVDCVADRAEIHACPDTCPEASTAGSHLAYAIFTSGTTGTPKLVGVEHRNISNLLAYAATELFDPADWAWVPFTDAVSADSCVHQIFLTLGLGGRLVPLPELGAVAASPFLPQFTWFSATPISFQWVFDTFGLPPSARVLGVGAEATPPALLARLRAQPGIRELYNFYGPTEATIYSTISRLFELADQAAVMPGPARHVGRIIGRPVAGTRCHVLDARGQPAPVGVPGELVIAGIGVARGYLNDPALTLDRFIAEPGNPSGRAYRTGDLARWHPDGQLEFLGRRDSQIKIHGVRVELEEIEAHLLAFPQVAQAVVNAVPAPDGDRRLVAYVVMPPAAFQPGQIRRFLRTRLANTVVPATLVRLDALPLTLTGKIDRQRLPHPSFTEEAGPAIAETETERRLVAIWAQVLRRSDVGVEDDFFAAGGDSLQAAVLTLSIEADFAIRLSAADLVECPSPRELAARIDRNRQAANATSSRHSQRREGSFVPLQAGRTGRPIIVLPGGVGENERPEFYRPIFQELSDHPAYCFLPPVLDHRNLPARNLHLLIDEALRALAEARVEIERGVIIWGHCVGGILGLEMARRLMRDGTAPVPVAILDPLPPTGRLTAVRRAMASTRLGVQLRYHRNMLREGDWSARATYARGVLARTFRRALPRPAEPVGAARSARIPPAEVDRHFQDLVTYPRTLAAHRSLPHAGPLLLTANHREATPQLERAWRQLAHGPFRFDPVPGTHTTVVATQAAAIGQSLHRWLAEIAPDNQRLA